MSNSINPSSVSSRTPALEFSQRDPKEQASLSIDTVPDEVLEIIFTYATENGRQTEAVLNLQKVCTRWDTVVESELLSRCWAHLPDRITSHALTNCVSSINLPRNLVNDAINKALGPNQSNNIPGRSHFHLFCDLTQKLIQRGIHVPHHSPVLGFHADAYEQAQADLDLEKVWTQKIQPQIQFGDAPIPSNAAAIRAWFQDPANAPKIANIRRLDLSKMGLQTFPPEIGNLNQLQTLSLSDNHLTTVPPEIGNLNQLQRLSLYNNHLTTLPPEIGNLNRLQWLSLFNNHLTTLPPEIGNLIRLRELYLFDNHLTTLPHEIGNLNQLGLLSLFNNHLTTLPSEIGNLIGLQYLYLNNNHLTTLPHEIRNLNYLRYFYLYGNSLILALDKDLKDVYIQLLGENKESKKLTSAHDENKETKKLTSAQYQKKYQANTSFPCTTPLARLCQKIHKGSDLGDAFNALSAEMKNQIIEMMTGTSSPVASSSSEPLDLFSDRVAFVKAVIAVASKKMNGLDASKKELIYQNAQELANGPLDDNIICLIEAMELATQE